MGEPLLYTTASGYLKQPDKQESPYRKCLGAMLLTMDTLLPEAFPIKASDYSAKWAQPIFSEQAT
jgi:hypothetical protein